MSAADVIRNAAPGTVVAAGDIPGAESDEVKQEVVQTVADGLAVPVYRLEGQEWTEHLSREVHGDDPAKILVGFKRLP